MREYYSKRDIDKEPLGKYYGTSRLKAAQWFANRKRLTLKQFLNIYKITK